MEGDPWSKKKGLLWSKAFLLKCVALFVAWRLHEGTLAGDLVRSHVPTMKAAPLAVTAGSVARRERREGV